MNEAILAGLIEGGTDPADIVATVRRAERAAELAERHHGITAIAGDEEPDNNKDAATGSGVVILGVKPVGTADLAREISGSLSPGTIVISVAAAVSLAQLEAALPAGQPVIRTMPNTPARLGRGVVSVSPGTSCSAAQLQSAKDILSAVAPSSRSPKPRLTRCPRSAARARRTPSTWPRRWRQPASNWGWIRTCRCCWPAKPWPGPG